MLTTNDGDLPELWHFRISHYNEKVRWVPDRKQIPRQPGEEGRAQQC